MTKRVRIENADNAPYKVLVEVYDGLPEGEHKLARAIELSHPTSLTPEDLMIWSDRYIVVREAPVTITPAMAERIS